MSKHLKLSYLWSLDKIDLSGTSEKEIFQKKLKKVIDSPCQDQTEFGLMKFPQINIANK